MPELPEVESIARGLRKGTQALPPLPGQRIARVSLRWQRHIAQPSPNTFRRRIRGRTILDVRRRGKYLVFPLDEDTMLIHLRMSGDLEMAPLGSPPGLYDRTVFFFETPWELRFSDARKFGKIHLLSDPQDVLSVLGPEPLDDAFTAKEFAARLAKRRRVLKPLLLDQHFLAGLGNIYVDESLHRAGIHPLRRSDSLQDDEARALWRSIRMSLRTGLRHNGASIDWVFRGGSFQNRFRVYQRTGKPCPRCKTPIERIVVAQRGTYFCPRCQPQKVR
jgi:formamidopyrimidine-DNA glycosylase